MAGGSRIICFTVGFKQGPSTHIRKFATICAITDLWGQQHENDFEFHKLDLVWLSVWLLLINSLSNA